MLELDAKTESCSEYCWAGGLVDGQTSGQMDKWMCEWSGEWEGKCMYVCKCGRMGGGMEGRKEGVRGPNASFTGEVSAGAARGVLGSLCSPRCSQEQTPAVRAARCEGLCQSEQAPASWSPGGCVSAARSSRSQAFPHEPVPPWPQDAEGSWRPTARAEAQHLPWPPVPLPGAPVSLWPQLSSQRSQPGSQGFNPSSALKRL